MNHYVFHFLNKHGHVSLIMTETCEGDEAAIRRAILSMDRHCHSIEVMREKTGEVIWSGSRDDAVTKLAESLKQSGPRTTGTE